jgi:homocysteine S-methyltransferase
MPHNPLTALLADQRCIVLDGALATELEARGCNLGDALWSAKVLLEQPQLIRQVHLDYFQAGAQCAITASYQATPLGFAARGLDLAQSQQLIARSAQLALEARDAYRAAHPEAGALLVAGSVGPYGAYLSDGSEYRGDYALPQAAMLDFHRPRIAAGAAANRWTSRRNMLGDSSRASTVAPAASIGMVSRPDPAASSSTGPALRRTWATNVRISCGSRPTRS